MPDGGLDGRYTVEGLTNDADYTFKVRAVNNVGSGPPSNAVTATPQGPADPNPHAPVITGPNSVSVAEGHTGALADAIYTTSDDDDDQVTLTLTDADRGPFSLSSSGTLQVTSALDFESDRTSYEVTLTATDDGPPSKSSPKQVTVRVNNVDEPGTVTLSSSSPQVGDHLTATLSDPDRGLRQDSWSWYSRTRSADSASDDAVELRATSQRYTVQASDVGRRLEVRVDYADAQGSDKSARATSGVVQASSTSSLVRTPSAKPANLQALPDILAAVAAPNPFNPTTTLHLQVPTRSVVWLAIYNIAGQVVRTLLDDYELAAGYHSVDWDGRDQQGQPVTSGVYLYHLRAGTQAVVHKLLLLR